MRAVAAVVGAVVLSACAGARLRSPVAEAPVLQSPIVPGKAEPAPEPECRPVYAPPVPHIDEGDDPCPGGVCRLPGAPELPGHDQKKPNPKPAPSGYPAWYGWAGLGICALLLAGLLFVRRPK